MVFPRPSSGLFFRRKKYSVSFNAEPFRDYCLALFFRSGRVQAISLGRCCFRFGERFGSLDMRFGVYGHGECIRPLASASFFPSCFGCLTLPSFLIYYTVLFLIEPGCFLAGPGGWAVSMPGFFPFPVFLRRFRGGR